MLYKHFYKNRIFILINLINANINRSDNLAHNKRIVACSYIRILSNYIFNTLYIALSCNLYCNILLF
jgi:hypothetical protein